MPWLIGISWNHYNYALCQNVDFGVCRQGFEVGKKVPVVHLLLDLTFAVDLESCNLCRTYALLGIYQNGTDEGVNVHLARVR